MHSTIALTCVIYVRVRYLEFKLLPCINSQDNCGTSHWNHLLNVPQSIIPILDLNSIVTVILTILICSDEVIVLTVNTA